jgi:hypothetical protein
MEVYELTLIVSLRVKKENQHDDENEVYNKYVLPRSLIQSVRS